MLKSKPKRRRKLTKDQAEGANNLKVRLNKKIVKPAVKLIMILKLRSAEDAVKQRNI